MEAETVIERMAEEYEALPTGKKQKEFVARWQSHIDDFTRLLWSCSGTKDYEETKKEVDAIQAQLEAIVARLSRNVK